MSSKLCYILSLCLIISDVGYSKDESTSPEVFTVDEDPRPLKISWIPPRQLDLGVVDPAGVLNPESDSPQFLYVARANYHDGVVPGQWNPTTESMLIGNTENEEIGVYIEKASVLHMPKGTTAWIRNKKGQQLYNMVVGGMLPGNKTLLYVCRAIRPGNHLVLGYRQQTGGNCVVSHAGDQHEHDDFEVLVITDYGMVSGAFV